MKHVFASCGIAAGLTAMIACSGPSSVTIDAPEIDAAEPSSFTTSCKNIAAPSATPYTTADDFGPTVKGTLDGWVATGRWFMTGIPLGSRSSILFEQQGASLFVDHNKTAAGTIDRDVAFQRSVGTSGGGAMFSISVRVSNRQADGTLRLDRAVCDSGSCRVCISRLARASWPAGEGEKLNLSKLGEYRDPNWQGAITYNVRVKGNYAYLVRDDGMYIIDVSDPTAPKKVGHWQNGYTNDVKLVESGAKLYALIADSPSKVVDVTDPTNPVTVAQIQEAAHTVFTETRGGKVYAYWGNYDATCPIYDVTDPLHANKLGSFTTAGMFVHDMMIDNGMAYLDAWDAGLYRVDYSNPATPTQTGRLASTPTNTNHSSWSTVVGNRKIVITGGEAPGARLSVVDVDPASPTYMKEIGKYQTRDITSIHNVMAFGNRAYIVYYNDGVRVLDLSDVTQPKLIGYYNTWNPDGPDSDSSVYTSAIGIDVDLSKRILYIADIPRGLIILKDETPQ
jgi:hypothetical protein